MFMYTYNLSSLAEPDFFDSVSGNITNMNSMFYMFNSSGMFDLPYDDTLIGWSQSGLVQNNFTLGASGVYFCNADAEHDDLVNNYGWMIDDAGDNCP